MFNVLTDWSNILSISDRISNPLLKFSFLFIVNFSFYLFIIYGLRFIFYPYLFSKINIFLFSSYSSIFWSFLHITNYHKSIFKFIDYYLINMFRKENQLLDDKIKYYIENHDLDSFKNLYEKKFFEGYLFHLFNHNINFNHKLNGLDHTIYEYIYSFGNIEMVNWVYNLDPDLLRQTETIIYDVCAAGNYNVAKWLYNLDFIREQIEDDLLYTSVYGKNLELTQWLYSLGYFDLGNENYKAFSIASKNGYLDIAKWIYETDNEINDNIIFKSYGSFVNKTYYKIIAENDEFVIADYVNSFISFTNWLNTIKPLIIKNVLSKNNDIIIRNLVSEYNHIPDIDLLRLINYITTLNENYKLEFNDHKMKIKINSKYTKIQNYINTNINEGIIINDRIKIDECGICYQNKKYYINFECNHEYCNDCFDSLYKLNQFKCMYCLKTIDINTIKLFSQNTVK
jgi:hypothetical protein